MSKENMKSKKEIYLSDPNIKKYISYLGEIIAGDKELNHEYEVGKSSKRFFNNKIQPWAFKTLRDAYTNYCWMGKDYKSTLKEINDIKKQLEKAEKSRNEKEYLCSCMGMLKWGGTGNGIQGFVNKYCDGNLVDNTKKGAIELKKENPNFDEFKSDGKFTINASYSKVYSLIVDNFVIYDSRVASALYLLAYKCFNKEVPKNLYFKSSESKGNKNRVGTSTGKSLAEWNARANWILESVSKGCNWNDPESEERLEESKRLRAIECALFMIGYDIGKDVVKKKI